MNAKESLTVNPAILNIDLAKDKPEGKITYENSYNQPLTLSFHSENYAPLESDNTASWLKFSHKELTLGPTEKKSISIAIDQSAISPGAHYGIVVAKLAQNSNPAGININFGVNSLVIVRNATGKEVEKATAQDTSFANTFLALPQTITFRFHNTGNVDLTPHGLITIHDVTNRLVGTGIINEDSQLALPKTPRKYDTTVTSLESFLIPGHYKITTQINYGSHHQKINLVSDFWSLGHPLFLIIPLVLILVFFFFIFKRKKN